MSLCSADGLEDRGTSANEAVIAVKRNVEELKEIVLCGQM